LSPGRLLADHYLTGVVVAAALLALLWLGPGRSRTTPARRRWLVALRLAAIGLVLLIMLRPTGNGLLSLGSLAVLLAAVCYALSAILTRIIRRTWSAKSVRVSRIRAWPARYATGRMGSGGT